eukprot:scaffold62842_cov63-Phaeocystis_antarctica.AAC.1
MPTSSFTRRTCRPRSGRRCPPSVFVCLTLRSFFVSLAPRWHPSGASTYIRNVEVALCLAWRSSVPRRAKS